MLFKDHVSSLARQAQLKVAVSSDRQAHLLFTVNDNVRHVFVIAYSEIWEFSCPTNSEVDSATDIPDVITAAVLERNAKLNRGCWAIETVSNKRRLECMHKCDHTLLTPAEFSKICWALANEVDHLENALLQAAQALKNRNLCK